MPHILPAALAGTVWRVEKQVGDRVQKGDVLALVDAAEVGRAKGEFLQAIAQLRLSEGDVERLKPLAGGAVPAGSSAKRKPRSRKLRFG